MQDGERESGATERRDEGLEDLRRDLVGGLLYVYDRLNEGSRTVVETAGLLEALVEMLAERGLLDREELNRRRLEATERLAQRILSEAGAGVVTSEIDADKYQVARRDEVDCASRIHLCRGVCCTFQLPLTQQDIAEGVVRWDPRNPFWIRQGLDGRCCHQDQTTLSCRVYQQRPIPCRLYSCKGDTRIWADFDRMVLGEGAI